MLNFDTLEKIKNTGNILGKVIKEQEGKQNLIFLN